MAYETRLASLANYEKGRVEVIDDDPKNYAFSNIFEVASLAKPFEQIAGGKNFEYVLEAVRVEGTSRWRGGGEHQSALVRGGASPDGPRRGQARAPHAAPRRARLPLLVARAGGAAHPDRRGSRHPVP